MRNLLEADLNQLRDQVLLMGGEVEEAIERDSELAELMKEATVIKHPQLNRAAQDSDTALTHR